ncbi:MAG: amino acid ABC transporter permease [Nanoarchaeota archaeon]|nr:amino acid ABC transporter permease [Nanoarchaeota archaeon]
MAYSFNFPLVFSYWPLFLKGLLMTIILSVISFFVGFCIALVLVSLRKSESKFARRFVAVYSVTCKAIPALVMIIWAYYALPLLIGVSFSPLIASLIALSINISPFIMESIISGINAIHKDQYESARVLGFTKLQAYRHIVLPQVLKNMTPDLLAWFITLIKHTSLVSIIGFNELLHVSNTIISNVFLPFEVYTTLAIMYILLIVCIEILLRKVVKIKYKTLL